MCTIYEKLLEAGCELDHHETDLYVRVTDKAIGIIRDHDYGLQTFLFQDSKGHLWLEIPFAYDPGWKRGQNEFTSNNS